MRAAIWEGPGRWRSARCPIATCPVDGVLLRVLACGICGTDVRVVLQRRPPDRAAVGARPRDQRRGASRSARGRRDRGRRGGISVGDPVHCISTLWCGRCRLCRGGNEHLCLHGELMGFDYQGAYAEHVAIPADRAEEPVPHPRRPLPRARDLRRSAVGRDLRPQGHRDRPRRRRRRDRRRARRHRARRARPRSRAPARCCCSSAAPNRLELAEAILGRRPHGVRRHRDGRRAGRGHARAPRASAPTS